MCVYEGIGASSRFIGISDCAKRVPFGFRNSIKCEDSFTVFVTVRVTVQEQKLRKRLETFTGVVTCDLSVGLIYYHLKI